MVRMTRQIRWLRGRVASGERERGAVAVITALTLVVMVGMAAVAIDLGNAQSTSRGVQAAVDAAALAGAADLSTDVTNLSAISVAKQTAAQYFGDSSDVTVTPVACPVDANPALSCYTFSGGTLTVTSPYSKPGPTPAYQVIRVGACTDTTTYFAGAIEATSPDVCATATAALNAVVTRSPAIMTLNRSACPDVEVGGSGKVVADGGSLIDNSNCDRALEAYFTEGTGIWVTATGSGQCICVVGGISTDQPTHTNPRAISGQPVVSDPYESLPAPTVANAGSYNATTHTYSPGRYLSKVTISSSTTFLPGIYDFAAGLDAKDGSNYTVTANNVLFYFSGGSFNVAGNNTTWRISAQTTGTWANVAMFQSRTNTTGAFWADGAHAGVMTGSGQGARCAVTSTSGISGAVYLPKSYLYVHGNNSTLCTAGAPIVVDKIKVDETTLVSAQPAAVSGTSDAPSVSLVQ